MKFLMKTGWRYFQNGASCGEFQNYLKQYLPHIGIYIVNKFLVYFTQIYSTNPRLTMEPFNPHLTIVPITTLPETNIVLKNGPLHRKISSSTTHVQGRKC